MMQGLQKSSYHGAPILHHYQEKPSILRMPVKLFSYARKAFCAKE